MPESTIAYSYIHHDKPAPTCSLYSPPEEIVSYLFQHIDSLLDRARSERSAPAEFQDAAARSRFEALSKAPDAAAYLAMVQTLADDLHKKMDGRSKPGFFVGVRRYSRGERPEVAVLKLDILDKAAAAARQESPGQYRLEAVRDLLDLPGDLHKGAVFPDPRKDSEVVVGDNVAADTALYFLRAIKVRQALKPAGANRQMIAVLARRAPAKLERVVKALDSAQGATTPRKLFAANPGLLTPDEEKAVLNDLSQKERRVIALNTKAQPIRKTVTADGIVIQGSRSEMDDKVHWSPTAAGGWQIVIDVKQEPRAGYD